MHISGYHILLAVAEILECDLIPATTLENQHFDEGKSKKLSKYAMSIRESDPTKPDLQDRFRGSSSLPALCVAGWHRFSAAIAILLARVIQLVVDSEVLLLVISMEQKLATSSCFSLLKKIASVGRSLRE